MSLTRAPLAIAGLLALTVAFVAPSFGYGALWTSLTFALLSALVLGTSTTIMRRVFPWQGLADACIRGLVLSLAVVVMSSFVLGVLGLLTPLAYAVVTAGFLAAALTLKPAAQPPSRITLSRVPIGLVVFGVPMLIFIVGYGLSHSPQTAYDSLSYHLYFPGRWLQEKRLSIIATPFSDEAQAYSPANGELLFLWLMASAGGDLLARVGQLPFLVAIGLTLYALARRIGARPVHAMYLPIFCLASRPLVEQGVGADVDLICWGLFLAALYLGLQAAETHRGRDWLVWGVAFGLYLGTKYLALVYAPILVLFALAGGPRKAMLWSIPGIVLFGAPWYVRNWVIAGSPVYPASFAIAGITLARGAYSRAAMMFSVFHTTDLQLFPVIAAKALGATLLLVWVPFAVLGAWAMTRRLPRWPALPLLVTPLVMSALLWFGVPDNVDARFLLPAAIVALLPLAFAFRASRAWNAAIHALYAAALVWIVIGVDAELPAKLPWFMGGWLSLEGLLGKPYLPLWIGLAACVAFLVIAVPPVRTHYLAFAALVCIGGTVLARGVGCTPGPCGYLQMTSIFVPKSFATAWDWVDAHISGATIAYTGNNLPYPLMGSRLVNHVSYVNIDGRRSWRFHDYDRAVREGRLRFTSPRLATSSGVLLPLPSDGSMTDAVRPRSARMRGDAAAWIRALRAGGVNYVFVTVLSAYEVNYNWHTSVGFPIEDEWARADPQSFSLVYENPEVRLYRFASP